MFIKSDVESTALKSQGKFGKRDLLSNGGKMWNDRGKLNGVGKEEVDHGCKDNNNSFNNNHIIKKNRKEEREKRQREETEVEEEDK